MSLRVIILLLFAGELFANGFKIDVNPRRPQVGSSYTVTFRVTTRKSEDPIISFDPQGAQVLNKQSRGMSMRTKFVNGKLFTEKEVIYIYELISPQVGTTLLKNIKVKMGGRELSHPDIKIRIGREIRQVKNFFVEAKVSKENVFVGEGITVKYYIYSRGNVKNYELQSYPKLKKFLKRFIDRPERAQNVEVEGQVFRRDLLYSARVFAEVPGRYYVDPIRVRVKYLKSRVNNPFDVNFSFQRILSKNLRSKQIKINVEPLPTAPPDINFTGLVGKHSFKLVQGKKRYLVNEAIELKLEVTGGGALEAYNGPAIYNHSGLEEFETSSDLRILNADTASKVYEYTYLARNSLQIEDRKITLTYFDPDKMAYEGASLDILGLNVLGSRTTPNSFFSTKEEVGSEGKVIENREKQSSGIVGPIFTEGLFSKLTALKYINGFLGLIICLLIGSFFLLRKSKNFNFEQARKIVKSLQEGKASYSDIFQLFHLIRGESKEPLEEFIKKQGFSTETQRYLLELIQAAEDLSYLRGAGTFKFQYDKRPFQELLTSTLVKEAPGEGQASSVP